MFCFKSDKKLKHSKSINEMPHKHTKNEFSNLKKLKKSSSIHFETAKFLSLKPEPSKKYVRSFSPLNRIRRFD